MSAALFDAFPSLRDRLPVLSLGRFPTRVAPLFVAGVSDDVELWVKRDDESGTIYGGNKVRKLEFLLAAAREKKKTGIVTIGGFGSHHVLATGLYARAAGLTVDAVVFPQPITPHVLETVRAGAAAGIRFHPVGSYAEAAARVVALRTRRGLSWIAPGGSSPLGSAGYVACGLELAAQIARAECPAPDVLYVALGSQGTVAGLLVGLRLAGLATRVVGVQVVDHIVCSRAGTLRLARRTARFLSARAGGPLVFKAASATRKSNQRAFAAGDFVYEPRYFGGAYGLPTPAALDAVSRAASSSLPLETTYTGKALAALLADAQSGLLSGKRVLFLDTFSSAPLDSLLDAAPAPATLPRRLAALF